MTIDKILATLAEYSINCIFIGGVLFLVVFVCGGILNKFGSWAWGY